MHASCVAVSMQDVDFYRTSKRKPVGVASVELLLRGYIWQAGGAYNAHNAFCGASSGYAKVSEYFSRVRAAAAVILPIFSVQV